MAEQEGILRKIQHVAVALAVIGVVGYGGFKFFNPALDDFASLQVEAEGGLKRYMEVSYNIRIKGGPLGDVKRVITKNDWEWYQANYVSLHEDPMDLGGAIAADQQDQVARVLVMKRLMGPSPEGAGSRILERNVGESSATFTVEKMIDRSIRLAIKVTLVKEKDLWVVQGFAGARAAMEGTGRVAYVDWDFEAEDARNAELAAQQTAGDSSQVSAGIPSPVTPPPPAVNSGPPPPAMIPSATARGTPAAAGGALAPDAAQAARSIDTLIAKAGAAWESQEFERALSLAKEAHALCLSHLGENHSTTKNVEAMMRQAEQTIAASSPNG